MKNKQQDPVVQARRHELAIALGKAIARERWSVLASTKAIGDRLAEEIAVLDQEAHDSYFFAEKPPTAADIQHNRGRRAEKSALVTEIEAGCAGKLVELAMSEINRYEGELREKNSLFYDTEGRPDYMAAATAYADALASGDENADISLGDDEGEKGLVPIKKAK